MIFDVDGTRADSGKLGFDATLEILKRYDIAAMVACKGLAGISKMTILIVRLERLFGFRSTEEVEKSHPNQRCVTGVY